MHNEYEKWIPIMWTLWWRQCKSWVCQLPQFLKIDEDKEDDLAKMLQYGMVSYLN